jgi:hypothetical protein
MALAHGSGSVVEHGGREPIHDDDAEEVLDQASDRDIAT